MRPSIPSSGSTPLYITHMRHVWRDPPPAANDESHYTIKVIIRHTRRPELGDKFSSRWVWRHDTCVDMCVCLCLWLWYVCQVP